MSKKGFDPSALSREEKLAYANRLRVRSLFLLVLFIVLASLFGAGGFAGLIVSVVADFDPEYAKWIILAISVASWPFLMSVFIFLALYQKPCYQKAFYLLFAAESVEGVYEDFRLMYSPKGKDYERLLAGARKLIRKEPDWTAGSYYEGNYRGIRFASFAFPSMGFAARHRSALSIEGEGREKDPSRVSPWATKDLGGRFFSFDLPYEAAVPLFIKDRRDLAAFKKKAGGWKPFESESIRFNEVFASSFLGNDLEAAYRALGPELIGGLLALEEDFAGYFSLCLEGKEGRVLYDHYDSGLDLRLGRKVTEKTLDYLREELFLPKRIIGILFLKGRLEGKGKDK